MWPFRQAPDGAHLELVAQIHGLVQRLKLLEESLASLEAAHERLRGRFYQLKGPSIEDRALSKAEILARMVPSRRT
jgi:hypothetical protein